MHEARIALVFLTINGNNGTRNPRSALVVRALKEHISAVEVFQHRGLDAVVLEGPPDKPLVGTVVVPLFDADHRSVNRWSPRPLDRVSGAPGWVQVLSTGSCVAVGARCVDFPSHMEGAARQIATLFSREFRGYPGHEYPWGPAPAGEHKSRRRHDEMRRYRHRSLSATSRLW